MAGWLPWIGGVYALYALGVVIYGQELKLYAGGIRLLSTSPVRALSQDLPIGLGLVLAGLAAGRLSGLSPARLKRAWQMRQADCLSLLAAVCALGVKLLIDAVFRRSPYYAWGHDILSLKPALPARVLENLELLRDTVIPYVWGLKAPLNPPWISLACLGLVLASALVCLLSGYPRWRQKPLSWLRENFPLYAMARVFCCFWRDWCSAISCGTASAPATCT